MSKDKEKINKKVFEKNIKILLTNRILYVIIQLKLKRMEVNASDCKL